MKNRRLGALLAALGIMVLAAGCSGKTPAAEEEAAGAEVQETEEQEEEEEPAELTEEEEQELYNLYIKINNTMVGRLGESLGKYFEYIDYQEEFTMLKEDYFVYSISDSFFTDLDRADELVAKKQEKSGLDEAYTALSPVIRELGTILNEIYAYTDEDSWQEDDYAKGKELHADLWQCSGAYETAGADFLEQLDSVASDQRAEDLARCRKRVMWLPIPSSR